MRLRAHVLVPTLLLLGADALGGEATPPPVDAPLVTGASSPRDYGVVIGIEDYLALPHVDFAARDADAFAAFLRQSRGVPAGRVVPLVGRISRAQILAALDEAGRSAGPGGTVWVYFSGHGAADPTTAERVLLPVETTQDLPGFQAAGIALADIRRRVTAGGADVVLVTDACFGGVGRDRAALIPGGHLAVPASAVAPDHGATWVATQANEVAVPLRPAQHGAFTYAVLGALRGWADGALDGVRDGRVTSSEADAWVHAALRDLGVPDQRSTWLGSDVVLVEGRLEAAPTLARVTGTSTALTVPAGAAPKLTVLGDDAVPLEGFEQELAEAQCASEALRLGPLQADRELADVAARKAAELATTWATIARQREACLSLASVELRAPCIAKVEGFLAAARSAVVDRSPGRELVPVSLARSAVGRPIDCGTREVPVAGKRLAVEVPEITDAEALLVALKASASLAFAAGPVSAGAWSGGQGVKVATVPAGTFTMGSAPGTPGRGSNEDPVSVTLSRDLLVMTTEVTQGLYKAVTGTNPASFTSCGPTCPVEQVSWLDAVAFANALSVKDGLTPAYRIVKENVTWDPAADGWRLPTEAEWEHAARGAGDTAFAGGDDLSQVGWWRDDSGGAPHPVCRKAVGASGLCDLSGNVWEWVWDVYGLWLPGGVDPTGAERGPNRGARGGSWNFDASFARVAHRHFFEPDGRFVSVGFRLVRTAP